ncbi:hypothetical protein AAJ76_1000046466 [Vairimorpha ceranae]|uniref:Secreted protein n=1 Tax=Vairimorpha ceranae TaxID=40302 RepID=A0A0F9WSR5_9MICR|nr:hypothetical protein AAJ76_1000046466 [Vairimorpha ceranae]KAF5141559.1 hypothetical protein G9O61_00g002980 [Vairimorpha ceranae]KKO75878.1 hypothetical protein AAJ76_1000046466 [Vairimorpha ceranae]
MKLQNFTILLTLALFTGKACCGPLFGFNDSKKRSEDNPAQISEGTGKAEGQQKTEEESANPEKESANPEKESANPEKESEKTKEQTPGSEGSEKTEEQTPGSEGSEKTEEQTAGSEGTVGKKK